MIRVYGDGDVAATGQRIPLLNGLTARLPLSQVQLNRGDVGQLDLYWITAGALVDPPAGRWALRMKRQGLYESTSLLDVETYSRTTDAGGNAILRFTLNFSVSAIRNLFTDANNQAGVSAYTGGAGLVPLGAQPRRVTLEAQFQNQESGITRHSAWFNVVVENSFFDDLSELIGMRQQSVDAGDAKRVSLGFYDGSAIPEAALVQLETPAAEAMITTRQQSVDSLPAVLQVGLSSTVLTTGGRRLVWWAERGDEDTALAGTVRLASQDVVTADGQSISVSWASLPDSVVDGEPQMLTQICPPSGQPLITTLPVSGTVGAIGGTARLSAAVPAAQTYRLMTMAARDGLTAEIAAGRVVVASKTITSADGTTVTVPFATALSNAPTWFMAQTRGMSGDPEIACAPIWGSETVNGVDVKLAAAVPSGMSYELILVANVV